MFRVRAHVAVMIAFIVMVFAALPVRAVEKSQLQQQYNQQAAALDKQDFSGYMSLFDTGAQFESDDGQTFTVAQVTEQLAQYFSKLRNIHSTITLEQITEEGDTTTVRAHRVTHAEELDGAEWKPVTNGMLTEETWKKNEKGEFKIVKIKRIFLKERYGTAD